MKKRKKKNAITLLALVITIVIMLLLAGVAIQMTMGENGLIAKSVQAQKEQAKAELYDTAKLSYMSLNAKALENGQPSPQAELALSTTEFTNKYNVVGDDITDKKGTVIESKLNLINELNELRIMSEEPEISMQGEYIERPWPKKVSGVTISEEDKDKMILKIKVISEKAKIDFLVETSAIDYGNGTKGKEEDIGYIKTVKYDKGEYILKLSDFDMLRVIENFSGSNYEIEVLQWGKIKERTGGIGSYIELCNVSKIYEPEPDKVFVEYSNSTLSEIPEWLFSKKIESRKISTFKNCKNIKTIPENLLRKNINLEDVQGIFSMCKGLTSIPEDLFKYNINISKFDYAFADCTGLKDIPEGLFKYNVNAKEFFRTFYNCTGLKSIPENLFKECRNAEYFYSTFEKCTGLTNIPENLFEHNTNANSFMSAFEGCSDISYIPDKIIETLKKVKENGGNASRVFIGCTSASNYNSIPSYMK